VKKTLLASLFLPMTMALFFSCKSTQGVAENSEQKQEIQEAQTEEASAPDESEKSPILEEKIEDSNPAANSDLSAWEEKIPQSEVDEFKKLYEDGKLLPNFAEAINSLYRNTKILDDLFLR